MHPQVQVAPGRRYVCNRAIKCSRVFIYRGISGVQFHGSKASKSSHDTDCGNIIQRSWELLMCRRRLQFQRNLPDHYFKIDGLVIGSPACVMMLYWQGSAAHRLRLCLRDVFFQEQPVRRLQAVELDCIAAIKVGRGQLLHLPQNAVGEQCQALRRLDG